MKKAHNIYKSKKLIKVSLEYDEDNKIVNSITITGDFFLYPEETLDELEVSLIGTKLGKDDIKKKNREVIKERKKKNEMDTMSFKFSKIRTLETGYNSGPWNMALDEALMSCINYHSIPILRIYGWRPPTVSIGYFQSMDEEVNIKRCKK